MSQKRGEMNVNQVVLQQRRVFQVLLLQKKKKQSKIGVHKCTPTLFSGCDRQVQCLLERLECVYIYQPTQKSKQKKNILGCLDALKPSPIAQSSYLTQWHSNWSQNQRIKVDILKIMGQEPRDQIKIVRFHLSHHTINLGSIYQAHPSLESLITYQNMVCNLGYQGIITPTLTN